MKYAGVAIVAVLLVAATAGWAMVSIATPTAGQVVGPATEIQGQVSQRAFLVIYTVVYRDKDHVLLGTVPGIRHWTDPNGFYKQRIATPRSAFDPTVKLLYEIHVNAFSDPNLATSMVATPDLGGATVTVSSQ
jgi:hypothetical protein